MGTSTDSQTGAHDSETGAHGDTVVDTASDTGATGDTASDTATVTYVDSGSAVDTNGDTHGETDTGEDTHVDTGIDTATGETDANTDTESNGNSDVSTDTQTDTGCAVGYRGPDCEEACDCAKLAIATCTSSSFDCSLWVDGNRKTGTEEECQDGEEGCFLRDYDLDLGGRFFVNRFRFLSDWWTKRPGTWDLLASDDGVSFSLVMSARSNHAPWRCVDGEPCTSAVPDLCCPGGEQQDTSSLLDDYPKWDDFRFTGVVARYWRFRIKTGDDPLLLRMQEMELYGHECLGSECEVSKCNTGVCTEKSPAFCTCPACEPTASCTSAFVGDGPGCTSSEGLI